jgi:hypothetical protein
VHNRLPKGPNNVRVGWFIKTDVTVAYLDKVQFRGGDGTLVICFLAQHRGGQESSVDGPNDAGSGPGHTFEKSSTVNAVVVGICFDEV